MTILIIDDSGLIRSRVQQILEKSGVCDSFVEARNGVEGFKQLVSNDVDLILCDVVMPVMDGFKFLEAMRQSRYHKGLPVIVITIKRLTPDEEDQLADMASAIVIKDQGFISRVRSHLATLFPPVPRESEVQTTAD